MCGCLGCPRRRGWTGKGRLEATAHHPHSCCLYSVPTMPGPEIGAPHLAPHLTLTAAPPYMHYYPLTNLKIEAQRHKSLAQGLTARKRGAYNQASAREGPQALTMGKEVASWTHLPAGHPLHPSWSRMAGVQTQLCCILDSGPGTDFQAFSGMKGVTGIPPGLHEVKQDNWGAAQACGWAQSRLLFSGVGLPWSQPWPSARQGCMVAVCGLTAVSPPNSPSQLGIWKNCSTSSRALFTANLVLQGKTMMASLPST